MKSDIEPLEPDRRLRICVAGDLDGVHTQSWMRYFVARGHEMHGVSFYTPARPPEGVTVHVLRPSGGGDRRAGGPNASASRLAALLPPGVQRIANLVRYRRAGIEATVRSIAPEVLHAHFVVEHGLYATAANFRPYVVSAWGSDVLVEAANSPLNRALARFVLRRCDLATANNRHMAREMVTRLGIDRARVQQIVLGVDRAFVEGAPLSVNAHPPDPARPPTVISTRSLDTPLYNIDVILRAMVRVRDRMPRVRLVVAGDGRLRAGLEREAERLGLGGAADFTGTLGQDEFRSRLAEAHVFVSVPSSDGTSVALLQAQAAGCFPIVSDLPSQQELVDDGVTGLRVPPRDEGALADAISRALGDDGLRRSAAEANRPFVEEYGVNETNMARMEAWYYRLAGRASEA